jgi:hypothetical protein
MELWVKIDMVVNCQGKCLHLGEHPGELTTIAMVCMEEMRLPRPAEVSRSGKEIAFQLPQHLYVAVGKCRRG